MIFRGDASGGSQLNGFLDTGSRITGELRFEQEFRIDGAVDGKVVSDGELVVGEQGVVEGEIEVGTVYISGTVRAKVRAHRRIEITASGKVYGEISTPALVIEEGALFEGRCAMDSAVARPESAAAVIRSMPSKSTPASS
ncbi:MAG TPA: polymer-forming cytoskeletal protein [Thermoanaerobaculia bacterium]|nr:polymer-forming cytoskeletal protein [Thermoanaerobaculia bacterium]